MTSSKRSRDNPVRSVSLRIAVSADRKTALRIKKEVPGVKLRRGGCEVTIESESPSEAEERARGVLEKLRELGVR